MSDSKAQRITFSLPSVGELAACMSNYNKHERTVIIKAALLEYFGLSGGVKVGRSVPQLAADRGQVLEKASANVLGDFED